MKRIGILTSGGDAPGMNAAIRSAVRTALYYDMEIIGIERGYEGLIEGSFRGMDLASVGDILHRGGTILKTARSDRFMTEEGQYEAIENLEKWGIEGLVVCGGDGSYRGAAELVKKGVPVVGIPGTIDNDLAYTDYTLGFDTAVNTVLWAINSLRDTMTSHDRVSLIKVMGRHCGDIALYSAICGGAEFALVPEVPYDIESIANQIKNNMQRGKMANVIVLAEGAGNETEIAAVIKGIAKCDVKITTLGHVQRGGSPTMADRMLAARFGHQAIEALLSGETNRVIGIKKNEIVDLDITEALSQKKKIDLKLYEICSELN